MSKELKEMRKKRAMWTHVESASQGEVKAGAMVLRWEEV